jgi:signal transduction histidine kinase
MRQLLLNLAQNALAAVEETPGGGRVLLAAERRGPAVELVVEDNGRGIPAEDLERIFDVFYSTRKGGTGLGLAIVERIARNHDGEVRVASEPGRGTTVRVVLPQDAPRPQAAREEPDPTKKQEPRPATGRGSKAAI